MVNPNKKMNSLSPIDGRYRHIVEPLQGCYSERALNRTRLDIEWEYVKFIYPKVTNNKFECDYVLEHSTESDGMIKQWEEKVNHDVKAVEYHLKSELFDYPELHPWIHFGLTSQDITHTSFVLMLKRGEALMLEKLKTFTDFLDTCVRKESATALLSWTHGQPASPTTVGKEFNVYKHRLQQIHSSIDALKAKLGGATGNFNAHLAAFPGIDWSFLMDEFALSMGLHRDWLTTQVGNYDDWVTVGQEWIRRCSVLTDFCQDMRLYISRGIFSLEVKSNEVGSSTMCHKVNPIHFENAGANFKKAISDLQHFSRELPVSWCQRDLQDSTLVRNWGVTMGHIYLGLHNVTEGLKRVKVNEKKCIEELQQHPEILAEPIQTILRREGLTDAYETLKELTRGKKLTLVDLHTWIMDQKWSQTVKQECLKLKPENYVGLAIELSFI